MVAGGVPVSSGSSLLTGLTAYYTLSNTADSAGSNTLTNIGGVTFVAGKVGNAANLVSASTQRLAAADSASFQMGVGNFTVAAWVKWTDNSTERTICFYGGYGANGYGLWTHNNELWAVVTTGDPTVIQATNVGIGYGDGVFHLAVATFNRASNVDLWVDNGQTGNYVPGVISGVAGNMNSSVGFQIGADESPPTNYIDAVVDEVGVWNRILTPTEITALWNGGAGTTYPFP